MTQNIPLVFPALSSPDHIPGTAMLHDFITRNQFGCGLHLTSTNSRLVVYLAAAVEPWGTHKLISIREGMDEDGAVDIKQALRAEGFDHVVDLYHEQTSYHWRMMKLLKDPPQDLFDFCVVEGGTTWSGVGFALCLAERLLRPGGWLIVDNLYSVPRTPTISADISTIQLPEGVPQTREVKTAFDLLVQANPAFRSVRKRATLAWAQKHDTDPSSESGYVRPDESAIYDAIFRARYDPELRQDLLSGSNKLPLQSTSLSSPAPADLKFVDTNLLMPDANLYGPDHTVVYLDRPRWQEHMVSETELQRMLDD